MNSIVQRMYPSQRLMLLQHFAALSPEDLRLRFGMQMSDALLKSYVERIDFSNHAVFGILNEDMTLLGMADLAIYTERVFADLGLSVNPHCRGIGYGNALLKRAVLHATHCGIQTIYMHCLGESSIMMHMAQKVGLRVIMGHGATGSYIWLDEPSDQKAIQNRPALMDYTAKQVFRAIPQEDMELV